MADLNERTAGMQTPSDPSVKRTAISGSAQTLNPTARGVHIKTAGEIVGKLIGETQDVTEYFEVGWHPCAFKTVTSATAVGFFHH